MRARAVLLVGLVTGCGRLGFDASGLTSDGGKPSAKPDASGIARDAGPVIDTPPGMGSYTVTQTTAPYTLLSGEPVPGFAVGADDENYALALPFSFVFYGVPYSQLTVSVNGYVTFGSPVTGTATSDNPCPLAGAPPDATVAVFWDDLYASDTAPLGALSYAYGGAAPDRTLTIEWRDMDAFYTAGGGNNAFTQGVRVTQEVVLHETGVIEMHYGPRTPPTNANKDCGPDRHRGCSATVGLEAPGTTVLANVQCGTSAGPGPGYTPIDEGRLITFTPN